MVYSNLQKHSKVNAYSYQSDTVGLYNQVHTDTGSR